MSPDPELLRFLGLSSESVSEVVVSSSLMLDLVEDGVGGEVLGAARTDLKQRQDEFFVTSIFFQPGEKGVRGVEAEGQERPYCASRVQRRSEQVTQRRGKLELEREAVREAGAPSL